MRKGGYKLIDMNGFDFATTPSSPNIEIYNNLNTNFNKVLLISNWYVNGVLMNDVFTTLISSNNEYQFTIHTEDNDFTYSINNTGAITLTTKSNHLYLYRFNLSYGTYFEIYTSINAGTTLNTLQSKNLLYKIATTTMSFDLLGYNILNVIIGEDSSYTIPNTIIIYPLDERITWKYISYTVETKKAQNYTATYTSTINGALITQIY